MMVDALILSSTGFKWIVKPLEGNVRVFCGYPGRRLGCGTNSNLAIFVDMPFVPLCDLAIPFCRLAIPFCNRVFQVGRGLVPTP